jgi:hypothetical protein
MAIVKILIVALVTFCAWIVLHVISVNWLTRIYGAKLTSWNLPKRGILAVDQSVLFRSPWYWLGVVFLVALAVLFGQRWAAS